MGRGARVLIVGSAMKFGLNCDGLLPSRLPRQLRTAAAEWDPSPEIVDAVELGA